MKSTQILFVLSLVVYCILWALRNLYLVKLSRLKSRFDREKIYFSIFRPGIRKFFVPIQVSGRVSDPLVRKTIQTINVLTYTGIAELIISMIILLRSR
jgi:hypothetical protein